MIYDQHQHLTTEEEQEIADLLRENYMVDHIARTVNRSPKTIERVRLLYNIGRVPKSQRKRLLPIEDARPKPSREYRRIKDFAEAVRKRECSKNHFTTGLWSAICPVCKEVIASDQTHTLEKKPEPKLIEIQL